MPSFTELSDRTRVNAFVIIGRFWQNAGRLIDALMFYRAIQRIGIVRELSLHPFEISEPRTVDEFIDHAHRNKRRFGRELGEEKRQFALFRHDISFDEPPTGFR